MKVIIEGQVLNVRQGVSRTTGKAFTVADIYDGEELIKVFRVDPEKVVVGSNVSLDCRLSFDDGKLFVLALK